MLEKHSEFSYRIEHVGNERQPVLIVENFLEKPELLIDHCCQYAEFNTVDAMYPGVRANAPEMFVQAFRQHLGPILTEAFGLSVEKIDRIESTYSMVVTPPSQLNPVQALPHFDSFSMKELASVYYLCGQDQGGTSLYRHRNTGFEYVDDQRMPAYAASMNDSTRNKSMPRRYVNGSNDLFERIVSYDSNYNRFIMYRCTSLHSGNIAEDFRFDPNPRTGRLTLNTFVGTY